MKKRFIGKKVILLALFVMLGMAQPIMVSADSPAYDRHFTYMMPGEILPLHETFGMDLGARISYCKPGTDPTAITMDDVIKTYHIYHEGSDDKDFMEGQKLLDFKDLGISGNYKQWLFVEKEWDEPDPSFEGRQYCAIPVKGTKDDFCYLENGLYSSENHSVTFSVSDEGAQKLKSGNGSGEETEYIWSTYQKKDTESKVFITSEKIKSESVSFAANQTKNEYTITYDGNLETKYINSPNSAEHTEVFTINVKKAEDSPQLPANTYAAVNYIVEYDIDLKCAESKADNELEIGCEIGLKYKNGMSMDTFRDDDGTVLKGHYYRVISSGMFESDGKLNLTVHSNEKTKISGRVKIILHPYEITVCRLQNSDTVKIEKNTLTVNGDFDPDIQYCCQLLNEDWQRGDYAYYVVTNYANMVKAFNITANSSCCGTITVDEEALVGDQVSLTLTPKNGYLATGITVKTDSGKVVSTTQNSDTSYTFKMPAENVTIDATFKALSNPVNITSVKNVTVKSDKTKAKEGETVTLTATAKDGYKVTGISVKDASGKAVSVKANKSNYTFAMPSSAVTVKATVKEAPYVTVANSKLQMSVGQKFSKLGVKVASYDKVASYKSSKTSVATVDKNGKITAKAKGSTVITVTSKKGATAKITVTVGTKKIATSKITLTNIEKNKLTMKKGESFTVKYELNPVTSEDAVSFKSSKPAVVTVDKNGKLKAKAKGSSKITVTAGKKTASFTVTVK